MNKRSQITRLLFVALIFLGLFSCKKSHQQKRYDAIYSGVPWFDNNGNVASAHGACIIKEGDKYYLFGERHTDTSAAFAGFNCYSSTDLYNWTFEDIALPVQDSGRLGPNRIGERVKVMKNPKTGEYVMYMHTDNLEYRDPCVGYATSKTITGPYTFPGPLLFHGKKIRKWDMGTFQDEDGTGYLLIHGGNIFRLSDDYKSISEQVYKGRNIKSRFESPAIFRKDSVYYFLGSGLTSWERNDNTYYTATSLKGPWTYRGHFAPEGTLTWNSQTTFVLPIEGTEDTTYMFMGDRWAFPKQQSAATYVWQPFIVEGDNLSIPEYQTGWRINTKTGSTSPAELKGMTVENGDTKRIQYTGSWRQETKEHTSVSSSNTKGDTFSISFTGTRVGLYAFARPDGGYAQITIQNKEGEKIISSIVDMYCKYPISRLKFLSPYLPNGDYTLKLTVMGAHGSWSDKSKQIYGSIGNYASLDKIIIQH